MSYLIHYSCISHVGRCRAVNQDCFVCGNQFFAQNGEDLGVHMRGKKRVEEPVLLGVFDGLGGEECGETAAAIAARTAAGTRLGAEPADGLYRLCMDANRRICDYASENGIHSMGATAAMMAFSGKAAFLCNIGDSKVFQFSGGQLTQLSEDHLTAAPYGRKPFLLQNLGIPETEMILEPYVAQVELRMGDQFLICTDGLTDMVNHEEIRRILSETEVSKAGDRLLSLALSHGGVDNITLILIQTEGTDTAAGIPRRRMFGRHSSE